MKLDAAGLSEMPVLPLQKTAVFISSGSVFSSSCVK
jgi:hypothetical protein